MTGGRRAPWAAWGAIWAVLLLATAASAQNNPLLDESGHDSSLPIAISADAMEVEQSQRRATFLGAVDARQGEFALRADKLVVHYRDRSQGGDRGSIRLIEAMGDIFLVTPSETAQGDAGSYDVDAGIVTLTGQVVLTNADAVLTGARATMNLATGESRVTGEGGRVNVLFEGDEQDQP